MCTSLVDDAAAFDDALGAHQDAVDVGHDVTHGGVEDRREGDSQLAQGLLHSDAAAVEAGVGREHVEPPVRLRSLFQRLQHAL